MGLPNLSPEEEYLLKKFALLKKKRKALQKSKEKTETLTNLKPGTKREAPDTPHAPEDAKEIAKKLIASGEVKIKKDPVQREFKRVKSSGDRRQSLKDVQHSPSPRADQQSRTDMKKLYDSFVPEGRNRRFSGTGGFSGYRSDEPRKGNTIFVSGYNLTEDILKKAFVRFGNIQRVNFEKEKKHGFVTFDTFDAADKAIDEMNGSMFTGVHLKVDLARRQPSVDDSRSHPMAKWPVSRDPRGSSQSSQSETRDLMSYDDMFS